jgi:SsrA-binding protein
MAKKPSKSSGSTRIHVKNKKAYHDYELVEKFEAGMVLVGSEVKSLRDGQADLNGAFARIKGDECWLVGSKISPYPQAARANHEPERERKLLLHSRQIGKIKIKLTQRGFTLVPLRIYFNSRGLAKIELALARGKRQYDKRQKLQQDQQKRDVARDMKKFKH